MRRFAAIFVCLLLPAAAPIHAGQFNGFDSATLDPVENDPGEWGLRIVVISVGQGDAILVLAPNGDAVVIDTGRRGDSGDQITDYLESPTLNGVGTLSTVDLLYTTNYDADHIRGLLRLVEREFRVRKAYDEGPSGKRSLTTGEGNPTVYSRYVTAVGDPNDNMIQDAGEPNFVRHKAEFGQIEAIGQQDQVEIRVVSVRGDTEGTANDIAGLDPAGFNANSDEKPGSIALLIHLGEFEFYTAGDQTDNDWRIDHPEEVEEAVLDSGAIPGCNDIDAIKVSHHRSDTSSSAAPGAQLLPEVAIISSAFISNQGLPKQIAVMQFQDNRSYVLVTGDGHDPTTGDFRESNHSGDDALTVNPDAVFNNRGDVTVLVSTDGSRYTVTGGSFLRTFSADDTDNAR